MSKATSARAKVQEKAADGGPAKTAKRHEVMAPVSPSDSDSALSLAESRKPHIKKGISGELRQILSGIQADINKSRDEILERMESLSSDLRELGNRVEEVEAKVDEHSESIHSVETNLQALDQKQIDLTYKLDDLENRGRRNNLRFRGVPEGGETEDVIQIVQTLCASLLGADAEGVKIEIDRAHRSLGQRQENRARDIITRFHRYETKEQLLNCARKKSNLEFGGATVSVYQDLSQFTLQQRRLMKPVLDILAKEQITYRWGFPFSLMYSLQGVKMRVTLMMEAWKSLHGAGLVQTNKPPGALAPATKTKLQKWQRIPATPKRNIPKRKVAVDET